MGYSSSTSSWKPQRELILGLIFISNMRLNSKLDPLTKFTSSSSRGINFTDILPWKISLMITKIVSINRRIINICTIKRSIPFESEEKPMKTEPKTLITISESRDSLCRTNIVYQFHQKRLRSHYDEHFSKDIHQQKGSLRESHLCQMKQHQELSKNIRSLINRQNRNKKPNKIKSVENINKDTQNFLGMSLMQKQAPP